jgi:hypothetical protein
MGLLFAKNGTVGNVIYPRLCASKMKDLPFRFSTVAIALSALM